MLTPSCAAMPSQFSLCQSAHCTLTELGGALDVPHLVEFVDAGGNLLVALDSSASELMRELVSELGVDVEPTGWGVLPVLLCVLGIYNIPQSAVGPLGALR